MADTTAATEQVYWEDVRVGDTLPEREYGPYTITDAVRWVGFQENWNGRGHYDRDHARSRGGLPSFLAPGSYRQALVTRMITDWAGPRGWLSRMGLRQTHPTCEDDLMRYVILVTEKSESASDPWIKCEVAGKNQEERQILIGHCTILLPARAAGA